VTATRERPAARREPGWDERSLFSTQPGVPWWVAIAFALAITAVGAFADLYRLDRLGFLFQAGYCLGCLLAVTMVQRKGLFGPMVQPPLILALTVPGVVLLAGPVPSGSGLTATALAIATPLINGFPTMALTTVLTLGLGAIRLLTPRSSADRPAAAARPGKKPGSPSGAKPAAPPRKSGAPSGQPSRTSPRGGKPATPSSRGTRSPARPVLGPAPARPTTGAADEQTDPAIRPVQRRRPN
jgi:hypothetical protein